VTDIPVALIIFNRPRLTQRVFDAIRAARPTRLLIAADGPRPDRPDDIERCSQTRAIVERIDWDCDVHRNYADRNLGVKHRPVSGLDWVFRQVEEAIILEDDCLPHPTFWPFCAELLHRYRDDTRIMLISGDNFGFGRSRDISYYFSAFPHIWGWASWRRAWNFYDAEMKNWPIMRDSHWLRALFPERRSYESWRRLMEASYNGTINGWDYQLTLAAFTQGMLSIVPTRNLVTNIGFGGDATHTSRHTRHAELPLEAMAFPLRHPPFVIRDAEADALTQEHNFSHPTLMQRIRRRLSL
jgi:hypothetical protein